MMITEVAEWEHLAPYYLEGARCSHSWVKIIQFIQAMLYKIPILITAFNDCGSYLHQCERGCEWSFSCVADWERSPHRNSWMFSGVHSNEFNRAEEILLAWEHYFPATIADRYDPERIASEFPLVWEAPDRNDEIIERIYIGRRVKNDTERLEKLF